MVGTGTSEDLFSILVQADASRVARDRWPAPAKSETGRSLIEAPLNLLARAWSLGARAAPASWMDRVHEIGFGALAGGRIAPFDPSERFPQVVELVRRTAAGAGREPALLAFISHGPVHGELAYLNFELVRRAAQTLRRLKGPACRPRLVVAVDPFALDTVPVTQEALYAGFMGHYHLGIDRAAVGRGRLSAAVLKATAWHRMPLRLLRCLAAGEAVGMALAGGVPATGRVRYAAREWLARQRAVSAMAGCPLAVLKRLEATPAFRRLEEEHPGWMHPASAWRRMEAWLMAALECPVLAGRREPSVAETGVLDEPARSAARLCLEALGLPESDVSAGLAALADELRRETPYRTRLFRLVARRVLGTGRPVVFVPLCHRADGEPRIDLGASWAWERLAGKKVVASSSAGEDWEGAAEDFAVRFGRENFR
ncbi:MAG: hypothetical protein HY748_01315 [Elusimicrobia bacterium]|nr:hypothetical protein [Elusimicrobiota bacterium]